MTIPSRKFAGFVLANGLFIASMVKGAVAAGIWECGGLDFFEGGNMCNRNYSQSKRS